jgi:DNA transformation protein
MAVSAAYLEALGELFGGFTPEFRIKRMFGGAGVFAGELMFALAFEDELYLRADDESRGELEALGSAPFTYEARGEVMTLGYWRAPGEIWDDPDAARRWASGSLEAAERKRSTKGRKKKTRGKAPELLISGPWDEE